MGKDAPSCPFSNRACVECAVYRGRHRYMSLSKEYGRRMEEHGDHLQSGGPSPSVEFQTLQKAAAPWAGTQSQRKSQPKIRLRVIDVERDETRICELHELEKWHWGNPRIVRLIDGWQVTGLESLLEILYYKAETGHEEVDLYETPRFMMLAGG